MPTTSGVFDSYGSAETQGYIAIPDPDAPINSNGKVFNILDYKV